MTTTSARLAADGRTHDSAGHPGVVGPQGLLFQNRVAVDAALDASVERWPDIAVQGRWLVNAHPKSGIHLVRNILMHFNSAAMFQRLLFYDDADAALSSHGESGIYWAHLPYPTFAAAALAGATDVQPVLLLRHPCAIALALARAFYDVNTSRMDHLAMRRSMSFAEIVSQIVDGYTCEDLSFAPLTSSLAEFCLDWLGKAQFVLRFEFLTERLQQSDDLALVRYVAPLLEAIYRAVPSDAAARLRAGAATGISATYSRTKPWASASMRPEEVYSLLPAAVAADLREVATLFGY